MQQFNEFNKISKFSKNQNGASDGTEYIEDECARDAWAYNAQVLL